MERERVLRSIIGGKERELGRERKVWEEREGMMRGIVEGFGGLCGELRRRVKDLEEVVMRR